MTGKKGNTVRERKGATAAVLADNDQVPVAVRLWLEQFIAGEPQVLEYAYVAREPGTMEIARLVFDVLNSAAHEHSPEGDPKSAYFPGEARDYVEECIYRLSESGGQYVWNHPAAAAAALPTLLDLARNGDGVASDELAFRTAIERLTTRKERREFFITSGGDRWGENDEDEHHTETAYKLSRVLADPATPEETRGEL